MAHAIPKELLKFRLDKQLGRLRVLLAETGNSEDDFGFDFDDFGGIDIGGSSVTPEEQEDKFQLYQRVLSWFIMGRLAKIEYDAMLEEVLINSELTDLHNRVIELLRAIFCDSQMTGVCVGNNAFISASAAAASSSSLGLEKYFLNLNESALIPPEELDELLPLKTNHQEDSVSLVPKIKSFETSVASLMLTPSEEALIAESLRNPIHDIICNGAADDEIDASFLKDLNYFKYSRFGRSRFCTEISSLPDQEMMQQRFTSVFNLPVADPIIALACKSLEDYMRNILDNLITLKFGEQTLLRPPISFIFPNVNDDDGGGGGGGGRGETHHLQQDNRLVSEEDLNLLFRLKPWLLADMESDITTVHDEN